MKSKNNKIIALFLFILLTILLTGMVYATTEDNTGETSGITGWSDVSEQVNIDQQDTVINAEKNTIITDDNNNGGQDSKAKTIDKNTDTTASKTVPANVTYSGEDTDSYDKVMELIERNDDAQELIIELNTDKVYVITDSILYMVHHNTKTVTVIGNGAVLDAMGKESFIVVDKGYTLNLKNLTVRNTYGNMGPAISSMGIVNVEDCVFENNIALYNGGAIASFGPLTVNRTRFLDNRVTTSTDGMSNDYGGGAIMSCGLLVVDNCVFNGNLAAYDYNGTENDSASGGAISVYENADDVSITNSNFTDNTAGLGGAIDIYDPQYQDEGVVLIDSNNFSKNCAYQGGAIALQHSATVTNNNFTENRLNESVNQIPYGAAIELYDENEEKTYTLTSSGNTFKSNDAENGFGGAILIAPGMILDSNSNVYENNKAVLGGAIYNLGNATVTDDVFCDNSAVYNGGAIYSRKSLTVNRTRFIDNSVTTGTDAMINNYGGGAILASGLLTVDNSLFTGNLAAYNDNGTENDSAYGGAIFVYDSTDDVSITNSNFTANLAGSAGAVYVYDSEYRDEGVVHIDSNIFSKNMAYQGGAISLQHSAIVTNNYFTQNSLNNENDNIIPFGAAIEFYDEKFEKIYTLTSSGNTFKANDAGNYGFGGAIDIGPGMLLDSSSNVYEDNKAAQGGVICSMGNVTVSDDTFTDNSALYVGGAIYSKGLLTVNRTRFIDNSVTTSTEAFSNDYGGGAIMTSGSLVVDNCVFAGNLAAYDDNGTDDDSASGGAIFVYNTTCDVSITNSNFTANRAGFGGAVDVYDPEYLDEGVVLIDSNIFNENMAYYGGAISLEHSAIVTNNYFTQNSLNNENANTIPFGAAIELYDENDEKTYTLTSSGNTFKANDAGNYGFGGAIDIGPGMLLDSSSNVYEDNKAEEGGAIFSMGNVTLTDDIFTDNSALNRGGAIYSMGLLTVNRTRFNNNSVTTTTDGISNDYGGGAIMASGLLVVDNSVFTANLAVYNDNGTENDSASGGAIFVYNSTDNVSITNSNFTDNTAGLGGAVYVYDKQYRDEGVLLIDSNNFNENMAYQGGAISLQHSAIVTNNNFTENKLNNENDNIIPFGAAIEFYDEKDEKTYTLTSSGNTFKANDAGEYGFGGATDISPGMLLDSSNNLYEDNKAAIGGAISSIGNVTVSDDTFTENSALYVGGAIYSEESLTVNRTQFIDNTVTTSTDAMSYDYGGGAIMTYGPLVVDNCVFTGNLAAYDDNGTANDSASGGAIFVYNSTDDVSITNSNFTDNTAGLGGAVYVYDKQYRDEGVILVDSNNFSKNTAYQGGAVALQHSAIVTNNNFTQNRLNNENVDFKLAGAAIILYDENEEKTYTLTSSDNTFKSNDAGNGLGGSILIGPGMLLDSNTNVYENNKASIGGAILSYANATLTSDTFTDNTAIYNGGAIASYGPLTLKSSSFISNNMTTSYKACTENYGGGAIMASGPLFVDDSVFIDNTAAYDDSGSKEDASIGGAILVFNSTGDVNITNSRFTFNEAGFGGALMVYDPQYRDEGSVVLDSNNFNNNRAYQGGAVTLLHSAIATNNRFIRNELNNENNDIFPMGGAIVLYDELNEKPYKLTLSDNTFTANDAGETGTGGAVDLGKSVLLDSTSNLYENNTAYTAGAISNEGNVTLNDDTFTRNTASYAGAIANYGQTAVTNCTFNDNKAEERVDVFYTDNAVMINDSTFHTDNLERLVGTNNRPLISATDNTVNDEFLEERLINSTVTLKLATTDLILDNDNVITGTLIDATDVPIFNKTVDLYVNNVNTSSAVTDENGEFTFHYMPTGGSGADIQVKFMPNDHYLVTESEIVPVSFVNNDTNITPEPKPEPKPVPATKKATRHTEKTLTKNNPAQTAKHTHTIRLASDNTLVWTGNSVTLEALNNIFDLNFTNGHLLVYIDGVLVFNDTVGDDLTTIIMELLDKYLGEHEIKVVFTDNKNNTNTYKENVIID